MTPNLDMEVVVLQSILANATDQHQLKAGLTQAVKLLEECVSGLSESVTERDALKARLDYLLSTCSSDEEIRLRSYAETMERRAVGLRNHLLAMVKWCELACEQINPPWTRKSAGSIWASMDVANAALDALQEEAMAHIGHEITRDPNRARPECPMGPQPCHNPACRDRCNMLDTDESATLRVRHWSRETPDTVAIRFSRELNDADIRDFPRALLDALESRTQSGQKSLDAFQWTGDLDAFGKWFGERWPVDAGGQISVPSGKEGQYLRVWCGSWIIRDDDQCHCVTDDVFRKFIANERPQVGTASDDARDALLALCRYMRGMPPSGSWAAVHDPQTIKELRDARRALEPDWRPEHGWGNWPLDSRTVADTKQGEAS